jgi:hypothetical protein
MSAESDTHADRKDRYHTLLGILRANTGHGMPPLLAGSALWVTVGHSSLGQTDALRALQATIEQGDTLRWPDAEGTTRYGLTQSGYDALPYSTPQFVPEDRAALRGVIEIEAGREDPDREVIAWANRWLDTIES